MEKIHTLAVQVASYAKGEVKVQDMATSQVKGNNFVLDGDSVEFYDSMGTLLSGGRWAVNAFGGRMLVEVAPESIQDSIQQCIDGDVANGVGDRIAMLLLAPRHAVIFYLEGQITRNHLLKAVEGDGYIEIPEVNVCGRSLTVRVLEVPQYKFATADAVGNVL